MTDHVAHDSAVEGFIYDIQQNAKRCDIDSAEFAKFLSPLLSEGKSQELLQLAADALALAFELSIQTAVIEREHYRALAAMQVAAEEAGFAPPSACRYSDIGELSRYREQSCDRSVGRLL